MDPKTLKIVTIGAWGHLGRVLAELDQYGGRFGVAGMAGVLPWEEPAAYQQKHPCARNARLYDHHRAMIDEIRPHVAIISTRPDRVAALAIEAAERGCHLICEKPLALGHDALQQLWNVCRERDVQCIAILNNHVHPVICAAREAVDAGLLGTIALANARKSYKWGTRPEWFGQRDLYGGTIPWVGIHALDFIYSATGQWFTAVVAMQSNMAHPDFAACEDNCALSLRLNGGGHATASLDLLRPQAADTHGDDWLRLVGSTGIIEASLTHNRCVLTTADRAAHELPLAGGPPCFVRFLDRLAAGPAKRERSVSPDMRRAFGLTHAALIARDSADEGLVLQIPQTYIR